MRRARMGSHKGALKEALHGAHLDVCVEDVAADLDEASLVASLQVTTRDDDG